MKKSTALKLACKKAFKQGEDPNIHGVIWSYKVFLNNTEEEDQALYNYIADWIGISRETQTTADQLKLLTNNGFIK